MWVPAGILRWVVLVAASALVLSGPGTLRAQRITRPTFPPDLRGLVAVSDSDAIAVVVQSLVGRMTTDARAKRALTRPEAIRIDVPDSTAVTWLAARREIYAALNGRPVQRTDIKYTWIILAPIMVRGDSLFTSWTAASSHLCADNSWTSTGAVSRVTSVRRDGHWQPATVKVAEDFDGLWCADIDHHPSWPLR